MFRPSAPRILVNWLIMFGIFLWQMAIRPTATQVPISQFGKFTEFLIFPFSRKSLTSFTAITAQFSSDSSVDAPRCGVTRIPLCPATVWFAKSVTYFFTFPLSNASIRASSSTRRSRAKFRSTTPSFILSNASLLIISFVLSRRGTWMVM